jgi:transcriptional regulator with XRE-family HTH domain
MVQPEGVVSLAERLKSRREELGISQSQAARELDVARTAYRLWEMEAAKPAPDRWRLIASWLGVSVTTMLFAEDLMSDQEAALGEVIDFARPGRDWNTTRTSKSGSFFEQVRSLIDDGAESGDINTEQAAALRFVLEQVEEESETVESDPWTPAELRRTLPANTAAARTAREAVVFVAEGIPQQELETARLLVTELVTNSVRHAPNGRRATVDLTVSVERNLLHIEVADRSPTPARPKPPSHEGGYGLALVDAMASRWGAEQRSGRNVTWFDLELPLPGRTN